MLELVCIIVGIFVGITWSHNHREEKYKKTFDQVDSDVRKELEFHKNLNQSLKMDVKMLRDKLNRKINE
jgi:hypothetical protein